MTLRPTLAFLTALVLVATPAASNEPSPELAASVGVEAKTGGKAVGVAWRAGTGLHDALFYELAAGGVSTRNLFSGRVVGYGALGLGVRVDGENCHLGTLGVSVGFDACYARAAAGPTVVTGGSPLLSGALQVSLSLGFGVRSENGFLGLEYRHLSNAGLRSPNRGVNVVGVEVGLRF